MGLTAEGVVAVAVVAVVAVAVAVAGAVAVADTSGSLTIMDIMNKWMTMTRVNNYNQYVITV